MGSLATWTFGMVVVTLLAGLVQVNVMSAASGENASVAVWGNAWLIYMVPYSLIVLSIGTPYFTRIAEHAAAGRGDDVRTDISAAIRILGLFVVISAGALIAAAAPASRIFTSSAGDALLAAPVLIAFLVGLVPMAVLFIIQRTFYAYGDTRTPFFFTLAQGALVVVLTLLAVMVPKEFLTATVASVQTLCGILELLLAIWLLRRKIGPLGIRGPSPRWRSSSAPRSRPPSPGGGSTCGPAPIRGGCSTTCSSARSDGAHLLRRGSDLPRDPGGAADARTDVRGHARARALRAPLTRRSGRSSGRRSSAATFQDAGTDRVAIAVQEPRPDAGHARFIWNTLELWLASISAGPSGVIATSQPT